MKVEYRFVDSSSDEKVVLECVEKTPDFLDIEEYALMKGRMLSCFLDEKIYRIPLDGILYFEAVKEKVFCYTADEVYQVKKRLYELEKIYSDTKFVRCSKSMIVNLSMIDSFRPALDSRFYARMKNGEEIIISRKFIRDIKAKLSEG